MNNDPAPNEQYPDEAFVQAIRDGNQTTKAIADAVGCERRTADYRLRRLREADRIDGEKVGNTLVWSLVDQ